MDLFKKEIPTKDELYVRDIIIEHLKNPNVTKEIEPSSDVYNLTNNSNSIWVKLGHNDVQITNHQFFYKKSFSLKFVERLKSLVKANIKQEQVIIDEQIRFNELELLRKIYKAVEHD